MNLDMVGEELDRRATEITSSVSLWEKKPQQLECLEGVIMEESENLPAFCNQKGQRWEEGLEGDHLLLCAEQENRGSEMSAVFDGKEERDDHVTKAASGPPPPTSSLKLTCPLSQHDVQLHTPVPGVRVAAVISFRRNPVIGP